MPDHVQDGEDRELGDSEVIPNEVSPLLSRTGERLPDLESHTNHPEESPENTSRSVAAVLSLLLIGVFIANADGSIVLATCGTISAQFSQLKAASWLTTSYTLAMCAAQPLLGKLSDIFGRKTVLLVCYAIFGTGAIICGMGQNISQVILGRAIGGIGGAGLSVIVSVLITDMVPKIEVAAWRSYVNIVATTGRSVGGPLGGWLADTVGWRWSFISQAPLIALAFLLILWRLDDPKIRAEINVEPDLKRSPSKLRRVDFVGSFLICGGVVSFLLAVDLPGQGFSWLSPTVIVLFSTSVVFGLGFIMFEEKYALEPIFPPRLLLQRDIFTSYAIMGLQTAAQVGMMFLVPLYFQITEGASNTTAGSHLVPAVIGNAVGGFLTGYAIKRTGRYKIFIMIAALLGMICYTLLILRWRGGINILESLEIIPGGLGSGISSAATFIALTSNLTHANMAVATSGIYLAGSIGMVLGVSLSSSIQKASFNWLLEQKKLSPENQEIIRHVLEDLSYIKRLDGKIRDLVVEGFVRSIEYSHVFSLICSGIALLVSFFIAEHNLKA